MNNNKNQTKRKKQKRKNKLKVRYRRNKFAIAKYNQRTRPSTYGPGYYRISVTKLFRGSLESQVNIVLYSEVISINPEFERVKNDFKYIKLEGIAVTFSPRNLPLANNQTPAYMILNYDGITTKNIRLQDSAKVIPAFLTRYKIYKFNIPKINSFAGIMNGWYNIGDIAYLSDLLLQIHAPNNTSEWNFKIDVIITLRGPTNEEDEVKEIETRTEDVIKRYMEKESGKLKTFAESQKNKEIKQPLSKNEVLQHNDKAGDEGDSDYNDDWGDL